MIEHIRGHCQAAASLFVGPLDSGYTVSGLVPGLGWPRPLFDNGIRFLIARRDQVEFNIAVLGGDGIGPEVTGQGVRVLEAVGRAFGHSFNLGYGDIGGISIDKHGTPLTDETRGLLDSNDAVLFGAVGGPKWDSPDAKVRPEMGLLDMRAHMGVFANIRPVKVYPWLAESSVLKPHIIEGVDLVVVRELTGGLYYAL
ncbi:MAG: hypothetical protein J4N87_04570, partial [Chloroflexi bacterium]|nr:hypothetical protein [Chloroflexota bacterium]